VLSLAGTSCKGYDLIVPWPSKCSCWAKFSGHTYWDRQGSNVEHCCMSEGHLFWWSCIAEPDSCSVLSSRIFTGTPVPLSIRVGSILILKCMFVLYCAWACAYVCIHVRAIYAPVRLLKQYRHINIPHLYLFYVVTRCMKYTDYNIHFQGGLLSFAQQLYIMTICTHQVVYFILVVTLIFVLCSHLIFVLIPLIPPKPCSLHGVIQYWVQII